MTNPDFQFRTNISMDWYTSKAEATACLTKGGASAVNKQKMAFKEHSVTVTELWQQPLEATHFVTSLSLTPTRNTGLSIKMGNGPRFFQSTSEGKTREV